MAATLVEIANIPHALPAASRCSSVVEQRYRKPWVGSSNLPSGSSLRFCAQKLRPAGQLTELSATKAAGRSAAARSLADYPRMFHDGVERQSPLPEAKKTTIDKESFQRALHRSSAAASVMPCPPVPPVPHSSGPAYKCSIANVTMRC